MYTEEGILLSRIFPLQKGHGFHAKKWKFLLVLCVGEGAHFLKQNTPQLGLRWALILRMHRYFFLEGVTLLVLFKLIYHIPIT